MAEDPLAAARGALDRGDYSLVLRLLEPQALEHPPRTMFGAELRLLMATALMGQGRTDRAAECCRSLLGCPQPTLRAQARNLLEVLEAPALKRPTNWSLTLPELSDSAAMESLGQAGGRRRPRASPPSSPPPPVGPTRAPLGFALITGLILVLLALLMGGCMEVRTDLRFEGPGRLQLSHHLRGASDRPTPWQRRFAEALARGPSPSGAASPFRLQHQGKELLLRSSVLPAAQALSALTWSIELAGSLSGTPLNPPLLSLEERNWLLGVRQHLVLQLDLSSIDPLPGVDLVMALQPLRLDAVVQAMPLPASEEPEGQVRWPLQPGRCNILEVRCWRWSPIGIGGTAISLALALVLVLQGIRRRLGYGLPELPA